METASVLTVSIATNVAAIVAFGGIRAAVPDHTPDVSRLLTDGKDYSIQNLPYASTWLVALVAASCGLAVAAARWKAMHSLIARIFPAVVRDSSAWNEVFRTDAAPMPTSA